MRLGLVIVFPALLQLILQVITVLSLIQALYFLLVHKLFLVLVSTLVAAQLWFPRKEIPLPSVTTLQAGYHLITRSQLSTLNL